MLVAVKFRKDNEDVYGLTVTHDDCVYLRGKDGLIFVEDATLPETYRVDPLDLAEVQHDEFSEYVDKKFVESMAASNDLPDDVVAGKLICVPIHLGNAWYVVTHTTKIKCDIQWRGFDKSRMPSSQFGFGRYKVPIADVRGFVYPKQTQ